MARFEGILDRSPEGPSHRVAAAYSLGLHLPRFQQLLFLSETIGIHPAALGTPHVTPKNKCLAFNRLRFEKGPLRPTAAPAQVGQSTENAHRHVTVE